MVMNKNLQVRVTSIDGSGLPLMQVRRGQEINVQNINVELVAQMFKNYRSNVLFHLEGRRWTAIRAVLDTDLFLAATESLQEPC